MPINMLGTHLLHFYNSMGSGREWAVQVCNGRHSELGWGVLMGGGPHGSPCSGQ